MSQRAPVFVNNSDASTDSVWHLVEIWVEASAAEIVSDMLWSHGVTAVEECATPSHVVLRTSTVVSDGLIESWPGVERVQHVDVAHEVTERWRLYAEPVPIADGIAVVPAWKPQSWPNDAAVLIEPGDAFGAGNHPSTRLAACLLMECVLPGASLFDLGCGTGVLAILAARHRGSRARVWDIAPGCQSVVEANRELNGLSPEQVLWYEPRHERDNDVVVANILAPVLRAERRLIHGLVRPGGVIILSGMRNEQLDTVLEVYDFTSVYTLHEDGWVAAVLEST